MKVTVKERRFPSATGLGPIRYRLWLPEEPCAALQLTHGMAEHIDRYDTFARFLAEQGVLVYGQDHAGHGKSTPDTPRGYFGPENGWDALVQDMRTLFDLVKRDHPAIPFILFGHSMGSFLARAYAGRDGEDFDAFVFTGTAGRNPALGIAKLLARREIRRQGADQPSELLNRLSFGSYNRAVGGKRTAFDWLSRDEAQVDRYVADPACGFTFTAAGMRDLFAGLEEISGARWAARVPDKPILIASGERDPVGGRNASGVRQVAAWLRQSGHTVELKLYPLARHEVLNETNRDEVFGDIALFIETVETMGEIV